MSIIAAGTTTTTALSSTGNTDGTLQFQVNGTTASVTLNTLGAVGVGASPNFGTSGQVLISGGSTAAPSWGTASASTTATNLAGGGANTVVYQSAAGTTAYVTNGSTGQFLAATTSGVPSWGTPGGGFSQAQVFTSSGTFTVPSSGKFKVTIIGGGGSGGTREASGTQAAGGGGGGGSVIKWFTGATVGATATITIGAGGAAVTTSITAGNFGGNSTFVLSGFTTLAAGGGLGGTVSVDGASVNGGTATGGDLNVGGGRGCPPVEQSGSSRNRPTVSGSTLLGIGGAVFEANSNSFSGTGYGSGSTGSYNTFSNAGQNGICIVEY